MDPHRRERVAVFGGVAIALIGTAIFARGLNALDALVGAGSATATGAAALFGGLAMLAIGVALATTAKFGQPGVLAALGIPLLALGAGAFSLWTPDGSDPVSTAAVTEGTNVSPAAAGLMLAVAIVATMIGITLLLVFGLRAKAQTSRL